MEYIAHEVAEKMGLKVSALHYYEKAGVLPPIKRKGKNRVYTEADVEWLYMIVSMREAGLPIRDIRQYVQLLLAGPETIAQRYELVKEYRRSVAKKIKAMQSALQLFDAKADFYQDILESGEEIPCSDFSEEWEIFKQSQRGEC